MIDLRQVMRRWTTGVAIVTVEEGGFRHGATISSLTSVSVDPPVITMSLTNGTRTHQMISKAGIFGVTMLSIHQQSLAETFSGKVPEDGDRFMGVGVHDILDQVPVLDGGIAVMGCKVVHQHMMTNSTLFIAEVVAAQLGEDNAPLLYVNRQYRKLED
jgi:flavin reductase (DIM6/NTAB) family NADH-FMN oxidoreductase RutF